MNDVMRDIVAIAMAVIGLAMLAIIIKNYQGTTAVLGTGLGGFGKLIQAASQG